MITTPTTVPIPELTHPKDVAVNPVTNRIYVTSRNNDVLYVVDGNSNTLLLEIPVCNEPFGVDVNSVTNKIYVACFADTHLFVIDGNTNTLIKSLEVGPNGTYVGVNEATNQVYVATYGNNGLVQINGATDTIQRIAGVGSGPFGLVVDEIANRIYVTLRNEGRVSIVNGATMEIVGWIDPNGPDRGTPWAVGINPLTKRLYITYSAFTGLRNVAVYDTTTALPTKIADISIPEGGQDAPGRISVNRTTNHIFIPNPESNSVTVINGATNSIITTFPLTLDPFGSDINPVTNRLYVGARDSNQLWVVPDFF